jgi:uncharacterized Zn-binding protein involved in type VI secretion
MPPQGRLGDKAQAPIDTHGCPGCPHSVIGPAVIGSPTVMVNKRPALRVGDIGVHAACCGPNTWTAQRGCLTVMINGQAAFRQGDTSRHCDGMGQLVEGSPNVIVGESAPGAGASGGSGGGGANAAAGASAHAQARAETRAALTTASIKGAGLVKQNCADCGGPTHIAPHHDPEAQRLSAEDDRRGSP